jgi:hypothetical protein
MLSDMPRPLMMHVGATMKALRPCLFSKASTYDRMNHLSNIALALRKRDQRSIYIVKTTTASKKNQVGQILALLRSSFVDGVLGQLVVDGNRESVHNLCFEKKKHVKE